jgi:hypothetical protein
LVAVRYRAAGAGGGGKCQYHVPFNECGLVVSEWQKAGLDKGRIYFSEMAPDEHIRMQGELVSDPTCGYALHYSTVRKPMRQALAIESKNHRGPGALLILQAAMGLGDWEDFQILRDRWPDSAIEFSCYSVFLGNVPRRNTLIWEVRNY